MDPAKLIPQADEVSHGFWARTGSHRGRADRGPTAKFIFSSYEESERSTKDKYMSFQLYRAFYFEFQFSGTFHYDSFM